MSDNVLSKENMEKLLQKGINNYLQKFYSNNSQNKLSEELVTGMGVKMIPEFMKILEPWIPKEDNIVDNTKNN